MQSNVQNILCIFNIYIDIYTFSQVILVTKHLLVFVFSRQQVTCIVSWQGSYWWTPRAIWHLQHLNDWSAHPEGADSPEEGHLSSQKGVSLNGGKTPNFTPLWMIIFSRKTHGFVGETHHFRKHLQFAPDHKAWSITKHHHHYPSCLVVRGNLAFRATAQANAKRLSFSTKIHRSVGLKGVGLGGNFLLLSWAAFAIRHSTPAQLFPFAPHLHNI